MPAFGRALASRSATIGPSWAGSSIGSTRGPRCHPSAMASIRPEASNTRPVTPLDSGLASQVTIGAIQRGERMLALLVGLGRRAEALGHAGERHRAPRR